MRKVGAAEIADRVREALAIVHMEDLEGRYPGQLSGGQKQRVALARSLAVRPAVLLFDEPLSALDLSLRLQLRGEIKRLHDELGFSAIYVTHDQGEAMAMSSRVAVMNRGRIEQIDAPDRIFHAPANEFVYTFIGESCRMPVTTGEGAVRDDAGQPVELVLERPPGPGSWRLYVRPSRLRLAGETGGLPNRLRCRIHFIEFLGDIYRYHMKAGSLELFADHMGRTGHSVGDEIEVGWRTEDMAVFG
jgi:ABC-type Fe3+/spermidine/putrescine transport system ATPase subunit